MSRLRPVPRGPLPFQVLAIGMSLTIAGPALALSSRTLFKATGAAAFDVLGQSVAAAGDVNGDGFADIIAGAPANDAGGPDAGRAYVYFGGPAADAVPDLTLTGAAASDNFGFSVAGAGDVNGDGFDDLIVGAYGNDFAGADAGRAYIYFGGPALDATADLVLNGVAATDGFGVNVSGAGDVNGDGFADVIVGASGNDAGGSNAGRAYVFYGGSAPNNVADLTLTGAAAGDFFGVAVAGAGDVNGDGFADVIVGANSNDAGGLDAGRAYVYYGGPSADAIADLTFTGAAAGDQFSDALGPAGDVNGDGFADVIVSARLNDAGGNSAGRAYLFLGGPSADSSPDLVLTGAAAGDGFGGSVRGADVNGDGFADLIVGAYSNDAGGVDAGRVYVYLGGSFFDGNADLVLTGAVASEEFGWSVAGAGDVDGDGFPDLVVGATLNGPGNVAGRVYVTTVYPYQVVSPNGGEQWVAGQQATVRWRGHDVADLAISFDGGSSWSTLQSGVGGEADNELTLTVPATATSFAKVRLSYKGQTVSHATSDASDGVFRIVLPSPPPAAAHRLQFTPTGSSGNEQFGYSVASAGDVNGDGYADVIVGAPYNDAGGGDAGRAYVYFGGPGADAVADLTLTGAAASDNFGISVAGAGDVNGDGYADVIVGALFNDAGGLDAGRAYVFFGGPFLDPFADLVLTGAAADDRLGNSVASAGDVNRDGFSDIVVGAPGSDAGGMNAGRAYVYYGGYAPDAVPDITLTGAAASDQFGWSVAGAGDVDGDGFADVIVGAVNNDANGADAGRAYVYLGGSPMNAVADLALDGAVAGDWFGWSLSGAGDVNGDGFADLIVGAWLNDGVGQPNIGRAYLYYGGPMADTNADLVLTGAAAGDFFGESVASAGDVNGDGFADIVVSGYFNDAGGTNAGRAYVYYGGTEIDAAADVFLTGEAANDGFGFSVAGAGDVDGDGFDDLIVSGFANDAGGVNAGRAYVYDFQRYFVLSPNDDEVWNVGGTETVTWLGAEPADLWLSVDAGATWQLMQSHVGGAESNGASIQVPHLPTRFARIKVAPENPAVNGDDRSDSTFTIQSSVTLLMFAASRSERGTELTWSTEPGVGPEGLAGYQLHRLRAGEQGSGTRIGPERIMESHYTDADGAPGQVYRLTALNGLGEELELGRVSVAPAAPLAAWPLPYREGALQVSFGVSALSGSADGEATVELFDLGGRKVRTLARGPYTVGFHSAVWDGRDAAGRPVHDGIYFLRVTSAGVSHQLKLVVAR